MTKMNEFVHAILSLRSFLERADLMRDGDVPYVTITFPNRQLQERFRRQHLADCQGFVLEHTEGHDLKSKRPNIQFRIADIDIRLNNDQVFSERWR